MAIIFVVGHSWTEDRFPIYDDIIQIRLEDGISKLNIALYGLEDIGIEIEPQICIGDTIIIDNNLPCWVIGMLPNMFDLSICLWDGFTGDVDPL